MVVTLPVSYSEIIYKALSLHGRYFTKSSQTVKQAFIDDENDSQKKRVGGGADMLGHMVQQRQTQNQKQFFWLPNLCFFPYSKFLHQKSIGNNSTSLHSTCNATLLQHILLQGQKALGIPISAKARGTQLMAGIIHSFFTQIQPTFFYHLPCTSNELYLLQLSCKLKML